jgi:uncharacterized membrane protein
VCIGCLIYFIDHAARSIQISEILARVAEATLGNVVRLFPEHIGAADDEDVPEQRHLEEEPGVVCADRSGYLQAVDASALFDLGRRMEVNLYMEPQMGAFVLAGEPLVSVSPAERVDPDMIEAVNSAFVLGADRTPDQDVETGIIEIADIAVKALSPGINDPTTALRCIDRLGEILLAFGQRRAPRDKRTAEGHVHFVARYTSFDQAIGLAFDQILHYGGDNGAITKRMLDVLRRLERLVARHRRPVIVAARRRIEDTARNERKPGHVKWLPGGHTA